MNVMWKLERLMQRAVDLVMSKYPQDLMIQINSFQLHEKYAAVDRSRPADLTSVKCFSIQKFVSFSIGEMF